MATERRFNGKRLAMIAAFAVLLVAAFGAGCKGFFTGPTLTSLTINPASPSVELGNTTTLSAYAVNSNEQGSTLTSGVSWSSSDPTTAALTGTCATQTCGSAIVKGVQVGTATITASSENVTNTATITVYINVSTLSISPKSLSIKGLSGTTTQPFIVTANGSTDVSSGATLTVSLNGTATTDVTCAYNASGTGGAGQYCTGNGSETASNSYVVTATYTGTTVTATAGLDISN